MQINREVFYKFKSEKDYGSISIDDYYISVYDLKAKIYESKNLFRGKDFDLIVTNAKTNEEYTDEAMLIPAHASVLLGRVPRPSMPIVIKPVFEPDKPKVESKSEDVPPVKSNFVGIDSSVTRYPENSEWDEFEVPPVPPVQCNNLIQDAPPLSNADEDKKIKALVDTPALDWQHQASDGFGPGRGFERGMDRRTRGGHSFGRVLERKTPPQGYICHRCKVPGHFIQHCPTNGDRNFDIKRVRPPTGIPRSMLMETPDGSYALPSGADELHCPLCKEVMKDAALTSKCCFKSFCDKCIREHITSKSMCVCGATNILADDLLPNKTLRNTINSILESNNSSAEKAGSAGDMKPACLCPQPKIPSPVLLASKGEQVPPTQNKETPNIKETAEKSKTASVPQQILEEGRTVRVTDVSKATPESVTMREPGSKGSAPLADEEVHQKPVSGETEKKKQKKKTCLPFNAVEMQWGTSQDLAVENYMAFDPSAYNLYWTGRQAGIEGYVAPYTVGSMGYGFSPFDVPFGGVLPPDSFGAQGYMLPLFPPQRDLSKDREFGREASNGLDVLSLKSKSKTISQTFRAGHHRCLPELPTRELELESPLSYSKRQSKQDHQRFKSSTARLSLATPPKSSSTRTTATAEHGKQQKVSRVFSHISFAEEECSVPKKRKLTSDHHSHRGTKNGCREDHHYRKKSTDFAAAVDYGSREGAREGLL